jgi:hypothetical protein
MNEMDYDNRLNESEIKISFIFFIFTINIINKKIKKVS